MDQQSNAHEYVIAIIIITKVVRSTQTQVDPTNLIEITKAAYIEWIQYGHVLPDHSGTY